MKKLFPLMVIAVVATMFTSCKKDYTCTCTYTVGGTTTTTPFPYGKQTKGDAKDACNTQEATYKATLPDVKCSL